MKGLQCGDSCQRVACGGLSVPYGDRQTVVSPATVKTETFKNRQVRGKKNLNRRKFRKQIVVTVHVWELCTPCVYAHVSVLMFRPGQWGRLGRPGWGKGRGSQQLLPSTRYSHSTQQASTMKPLFPLCVHVFEGTRAQRHNGCADCWTWVSKKDKKASPRIWLPLCLLLLFIG